MPVDEKIDYLPVALLLGSNMGNKKATIEIAIDHLRKVGKTTAQSSYYRTAAWGKTNQEDFVNLALILNTHMSPQQLLDKILMIERKMGRVRQAKWEPRIIDIDILFYDNLLMQSEELTIPHPLLDKRRFALAPLAEIAPDWTHPGLKKNITELLRCCTDSLKVKRLS